MYAVSTNQIADIFHFNDNKEYFTILKKITSWLAYV